MTDRTPIPAAERLQVNHKDAADLLSISERLLYYRTKSGEIRSTGKGRLRRYAVADLRAWMERNRNGGDDA